MYVRSFHSRALAAKGCHAEPHTYRTHAFINGLVIFVSCKGLAGAYIRTTMKSDKMAPILANLCVSAFEPSGPSGRSLSRFL